MTKRSGITRAGFYGNVRDNVIGISAFLGPIILCLYAMMSFSPLDQNDPAMGWSAGAGYAVTLVLLLSYQKQLFPWGSQLPGLKAIGIVAFSLPGAALALALFLIGNAVLDSRAPVERSFVVIDKSGPPVLIVRPRDGSSGTYHIDARRDYWSLKMGTTIRVQIKPGFFRRPWVNGYRLDPSNSPNRW